MISKKFHKVAKLLMWSLTVFCSVNLSDSALALPNENEWGLANENEWGLGFIEPAELTEERKKELYKKRINFVDNNRTDGSSFCLALPDYKENYRTIERELMEEALLACKKAILDFPTGIDTYEEERSYAKYLRNVNDLFFRMKKYSEAKVFYNELLSRINQELEDIKSADSDSFKLRVVSQTKQYPVLIFLGDLKFIEGEYESAIKFYLEADRIYAAIIDDYEKKVFFGGIGINSGIDYGVTAASFLRTNSFIGSRARLAHALAEQRKYNEADKYLTQAIDDVERCSYSFRFSEDAFVLQEVASLLYTMKIRIHLKKQEYDKALEIADRSRSIVNTRSFGAYDEVPDLSFKDIQALAKEQNATFVLYSIPDRLFYDYQNFERQENNLLIWVVKPDGKLHFKDVDVTFILSQSGESFRLAEKSTRAGRISLKAVAFLPFMLSILLQKKRTRTFYVAGFLVLFSIGACQYNSSNSDQPDQGNSQFLTSINNLSELTEITLSALQSRGNNDDKLSNEGICFKEDKCLRSLYRLLIQPIDKFLPNAPEDHVVFVPHRGLHRIPFAALIAPDNTYVLENHTTRVISSLKTLKIILTKSRERIYDSEEYLIVGNPAYANSVILDESGEKKPIPQLPAAELEAIEISKLYGTEPLIGENASLSSVGEKLSTSRIIHLATHGYLNVRGTRESAFALAPEESSNFEDGRFANAGVNEDGLFSTDSLYRMRLVAELAVLSACDTGLGVESVEGNLGLTRPFLVAGVPTVISSLWSVPDQSTAELMIAFHKNLKENSDKAAALRNAMLATKEKYPDIVHWAGFALTGLAELPEASVLAKPVVGKIYSHGTHHGDSLSQWSADIHSATLESTPSGFTLLIDNDWRFELDNQLRLQSSYLYVEEEKKWYPTMPVSVASKIPFEIELDGTFKFHGPQTSRTYYGIEGKLEFLGDAADKLARVR